MGLKYSNIGLRLKSYGFHIRLFSLNGLKPRSTGSNDNRSQKLKFISFLTLFNYAIVFRLSSSTYIKQKIYLPSLEKNEFV